MKYNVNAGVVTVDSTNGMNFHRYTQAKAYLYDHDNHGPTEKLLGVISDDDTVQFTLTASEHNKFKDKPNIGIQFNTGWMRYANGQSVGTGDNNVTRTNIPPDITSSSYNIGSGVISLTVASDVKEVKAGSICVVLKSYSGALLSKCATSATFSDNTITAYVLHSTSIFDDTATLEVSKHAIKSTEDVWNKNAYLKNLPSRVSDLAASSGADQISLSWSEPASVGSSVTGYLVQVWESRGGTGKGWTDTVSGTGYTHYSSSSYAPRNAIGGVLYEYRVSAVNSLGESMWSDTVFGSIIRSSDTVPAKVSTPTVQLDNRTGEMAVSWDEPNNGGQFITGYQIEWSAAGVAPTTEHVSGTSWWHENLFPGTLYAYSVAAENVVGPGPASDTVYAWSNATEPAKVTDLAAVPGATIQLSWSAPSERGSAITGYTVEWKATGGNATTVAVNGTSWEHTGVTAGALYEYRVRAANSVGDGPWSDTTSAQASATIPAQITDLTATSGTTIQISWSAPSDGGSAITGYTVEWKATGGNATTVAVNGTSWEHTGVTAGALYEYRVRAANSVGDGPWSGVASAWSNSTRLP